MTRRLLDCDALLALGFAQHVHHAKVGEFFATHSKDNFLTTPITELAFVRVGVNAKYFPDIRAAVSALKALKFAAGSRVELLHDDAGIEELPEDVVHPCDTTDGHLLALARKHGAKLLTVEGGIPGAELTR